MNRENTNHQHNHNQQHDHYTGDKRRYDNDQPDFQFEEPAHKRTRHNYQQAPKPDNYRDFPPKRSTVCLDQI